MSKWCSAALGALLIVVASCAMKKEEPAPVKKKEVAVLEPSKSGAPDRGVMRRKGKESPCTGGQCLPVPHGIKGLSFGMSRKAAEAVVGRTRKGKRIKHEVRVEGERKGPCNIKKIELPGEARRLRTTLGGEKAKCKLEFAEGGLTNIECDLSAKRDKESHKQVVDALLASLWRRYGWETHATKSDLYRNNFLTWTGEDAKLVVHTRSYGRNGSRIIVNNRARAHHVAIEKAARDAVQACKDKIAAEADERERTKLEREAELLRKSMEFESDFLPPLEGHDDSP